MTPILIRYSTLGTDLGTFASVLGGPVGLAVNSAGNVYVGDGNASIEENSSAGTLLNTITANLNNPGGLAVRSDGDLYVGNYGNITIERFSSPGTDLGSFGPPVNNPVGATDRGRPPNKIHGQPHKNLARNSNGNLRFQCILKSEVFFLDTEP